MSTSSPSLNGCSSTSPNGSATNNFANYYPQNSFASTSHQNGQYTNDAMQNLLQAGGMTRDKMPQNGYNPAANFVPSASMNPLINGFDIKVCLFKRFWIEN